MLVSRRGGRRGHARGGGGADSVLREVHGHPGGPGFAGLWKGNVAAVHREPTARAARGEGDPPPSIQTLHRVIGRDLTAGEWAGLAGDWIRLGSPTVAGQGWTRQPAQVTGIVDSSSAGDVCLHRLAGRWTGSLKLVCAADPCRFTSSLRGAPVARLWGAGTTPPGPELLPRPVHTELGERGELVGAEPVAPGFPVPAPDPSPVKHAVGRSLDDRPARVAARRPARSGSLPARRGGGCWCATARPAGPGPPHARVRRGRRGVRSTPAPRPGFRRTRGRRYPTRSPAPPAPPARTPVRRSSSRRGRPAAGPTATCRAGTRPRRGPTGGPPGAPRAAGTGRRLTGAAPTGGDGPATRV